jgi:hypothetical protein
MRPISKTIIAQNCGAFMALMIYDGPRLEVSLMALSFAWLIRPDSLWSQCNNPAVSCGHGHWRLAVRAAGLSPSTMTSPTCTPMPEHYHLILLAQALVVLGRYGEGLAALHGGCKLTGSPGSQQGPITVSISPGLLLGLFPLPSPNAARERGEGAAGRAEVNLG